MSEQIDDRLAGTQSLRPLASIPEASHVTPTQCRPQLQKLVSCLSGVIRGKQEAVDVLVTAILAGGSVLMDDVPGVGKTTLAKALARSLDVVFNRVQFTPDLLPSDILGASIYNPVDGSFTFRKGPVFCNVLLADEINRASPRTQSALLEAMSEAQTTIEGVRHELPDPFIVLATQNPIDFHGTYPLPEAQLDRFLVYMNLGYPNAETELDILFDQAIAHPIDSLQPVLDRDDVVSMQAAVRRIHVDRSVGQYIVELVTQSRSDARLKLGVSPRGSLMLFRATQAAAFLAGSDHATPDDVQKMSRYVLPHRIVLTSKSRYGSVSRAEIIDDLLKSVRVPV
ncbi:MAG: MoxR family ATPase [Planctomycetota bacterium]|nr:MoxR family ATPase [Planctomycetota bacterium]MDA1164457.1 MoxR family ATPase [Planctomycetota bacterium]